MPKSHTYISDNGCAQETGERGMTMLELLIAMAILAVGMTGAMGMILAGVKSDVRNKNDTAAIVLDQEILERFATYNNYPTAGSVAITDCSTNLASNTHLASVVGSAAGSGAVLYTGATAPFPVNVGDIDWTQPAPALATNAATGYAMDYTTCNGDVYEVRWNIVWVNGSNRVGALTVSSRQTVSAGSSQAMLFAVPTSLHTIID